MEKADILVANICFITSQVNSFADVQWAKKGFVSVSEPNLHLKVLKTPNFTY